MNQDIRISTGYRDHRKIRKLRKLLGGDGIASHVFLLCHAGKYAFDGRLKDMDVNDIEEVASWRGNPGQFVQTCVDLRLLDNEPDCYSIHNWEKWNKYAATFPIRSATAKENIAKRWEKRDRQVKKTQGNQKHNMSRITDGNTDSNTPSPPPTPSPKGSGREAGPPLEGEAGLPSVSMDQVLEMATKIEEQEDIKGIRDACIDAEKRGVMSGRLYVSLISANITGYKELSYNIRKLKPMPSS